MLHSLLHLYSQPRADQWSNRALQPNDGRHVCKACRFWTIGLGCHSHIYVFSIQIGSSPYFLRPWTMHHSWHYFAVATERLWTQSHYWICRARKRVSSFGLLIHFERLFCFWGVAARKNNNMPSRDITLAERAEREQGRNYSVCFQHLLSVLTGPWTLGQDFVLEVRCMLLFHPARVGEGALVWLTWEKVLVCFEGENSSFAPPSDAHILASCSAQVLFSSRKPHCTSSI